MHKSSHEIQISDKVRLASLSPLMPTLWHEFLIRPVDFFTENPVMTLLHQP